MLGPFASRRRMPDPTTLLLIRHGQTDWIARGVAGRLPDVHLNEEGRDQAPRLAGRGLATFPVTRVPLPV
jgi:broad specificity phosphatase PhoE